MRLKKFFLPFAIMALALGLAACGNGDKEEDEQAGTEEQVDQEALNEMKEKLAKQQVEDDVIVAVVNDEELEGEKYNTVLQSIQMQYQEMGVDPTAKEVAEQIQSHTLDKVVNQTLILQQAHAESIEVASDEIDNEYEMLAEQYGGEEALDAVLESLNMEKDTFRDQIETSILYSKYIEKVAPAEEISDEAQEAQQEKIMAHLEKLKEDAEIELKM